MILTKKSQNCESLFTKMSVDEMYDVNGGSNNLPYESIPEEKIEYNTSKKKEDKLTVGDVIKGVVSAAIATVSTLDNPYDHTTAVNQGINNILSKRK